MSFLTLEGHPAPPKLHTSPSPSTSFLSFGSAASSSAINRPTPKPDQSFSPYGVPPILMAPFMTRSQSPPPSSSFFVPFSTLDERSKRFTPGGTGASLPTLVERRSYSTREREESGSTFGKKEKRESMRLPIMPLPSTGSPRREIQFERMIPTAPPIKDYRRQSPTSTKTRSIDLGPFEDEESEMSLVEVLELLSGPGDIVAGELISYARTGRDHDTYSLSKTPSSITRQRSIHTYTSPLPTSPSLRSHPLVHVYRPPPLPPAPSRSSIMYSPLPSIPSPVSPTMSASQGSKQNPTPGTSLMPSRPHVPRRSSSWSVADDGNGQRVPLVLASELLPSDHHSPPIHDVHAPLSFGRRPHRASSTSPITTLIPDRLLSSRFLRRHRPSTAPSITDRPTLPRLEPRNERSPRELIRADSGRRGMTVLSFLLLDEGQTSSDGGSNPSLEVRSSTASSGPHIISPSELAKATRRRSTSPSSFEEECQGSWRVSSPLSSPSTPTLPRPEAGDVPHIPTRSTGLPPPRRARPFSRPWSPQTPPSSAKSRMTLYRSIPLGELPDTPTSPSFVGTDENVSPRTVSSDWSVSTREREREREAERRGLEVWLASKPMRVAKGAVGQVRPNA